MPTATAPSHDHRRGTFAGAILLTFVVSAPVFATVQPFGIFRDSCVIQCNLPARIWGTAAASENVTITVAGQTKSAVTTADGVWLITLVAVAPGGPYQMMIKGSNTITLNGVRFGEVWLGAGQSNMSWDHQIISIPIDTAQHGSVRYLGPARGIASSPWIQAQASPTQLYFAKYLYPYIRIPIGVIDVAIGASGADQWHVLDGNLFQEVMAQLKNLTFRGVIWWQGDGATSEDAMNTQSGWIDSVCVQWRQYFDNGEFPFIFSQLERFNDSPGWNGPQWARDVYRRVSSRHVNTTVVWVADSTDGDLHPAPWCKDIMGRRFAKSAAGCVYKKNVVWCGPLFRRARAANDTMVVEFDHAAGGLVAGDKILQTSSSTAPSAQGFGTRASNGKITEFDLLSGTSGFAAVDPIIRDTLLKIPLNGKAGPYALRYGWSVWVEGNIYNSARWPASGFLTDTFTTSTTFHNNTQPFDLPGIGSTTRITGHVETRPVNSRISCLARAADVSGNVFDITGRRIMHTALVARSRTRTATGVYVVQRSATTTRELY